MLILPYKMRPGSEARSSLESISSLLINREGSMPIKRLLIRNHRSRFLMILLVVEIGALFPAILAAQWPMQGYNARRTGSCPYPGPITSEVKWFYDFGVRLQDNASPIVGPDHTIYQITEPKYLQAQGARTSRLFAINPNGTRNGTPPPAGGSRRRCHRTDPEFMRALFLTDTIMAIKTEDGSTDWEFPLPIDTSRSVLFVVGRRHSRERSMFVLEGRPPFTR